MENNYTINSKEYWNYRFDYIESVNSIKQREIESKYREAHDEWQKNKEL
ncbi:hypothetical protein [uncultured Clostridium sp.]|nr:hypothetical protein [uncultured Clostridium sp.]